MTRRSILFTAICLMGIFYAGSLFAQSKPQTTGNAAGASAHKPAEKAQVMVLGMYHFTSKNNVYTPDVDDVMSPKRQAEIADLVARLREFKPTKIAIEAAHSDVIQGERYAQYLAGKYTLSANERDQIGFRLAKESNNKQIYPIDSQTSFDLETLTKFAQQNGQTRIVQKATANFETLNREFNELQRHATISELLRYFNSEHAVNINHHAYLTFNAVGRDENYAGTALVSEWYKRNLLIFANLQRIIESPQDRVLIIYGQGHAKLLKQFIQDSPDMELVEVNKYL